MTDRRFPPPWSIETQKACFTVARLLDSAGRSGLICAPSASRARDGERAADPLHRARINAKTLGDAAYTFTSALTLVQGRLDSLLKFGGYRTYIAARFVIGSALHHQQHRGTDVRAIGWSNARE